MTIVWSKDAKRRLTDEVLYAVDNFGLKVATQFHNRVMEIENRLIENPKMGHEELLLSHKKYVYRSVLVQKNFKLVYRIDEKEDILFIADLWDTRQEPKKLVGRIK